MSRKDARDTRSNQLNPNNDAYWAARGYDEQPDDWLDRMEEEDGQRDHSRSAHHKK